MVNETPQPEQPKEPAKPVEDKIDTWDTPKQGDYNPDKRYEPKDGDD